MSDYDVEKETEKYIKQFRQYFPSWSEDMINSEAKKRAIQYSTVKHGVNVIHIEYYSHIIKAKDIFEIEEILNSTKLELSHLDKSRAIYATIDISAVDILLFISLPIVQNVLLNLGSSALWDGIKKVTTLLWRRTSGQQKREENKLISCGMTIKLNEHTSVTLKFEGDGAVETFHQSLEKILPLINDIQPTEVTSNNNFYVFDSTIKNWKSLCKLPIKQQHLKLEKSL